jgi:hypothetical protein
MLTDPHVNHASIFYEGLLEASVKALRAFSIDTVQLVTPLDNASWFNNREWTPHPPTHQGEDVLVLTHETKPHKKYVSQRVQHECGQ